MPRGRNLTAEEKKRIVMGLQAHRQMQDYAEEQDLVLALHVYIEMGMPTAPSREAGEDVAVEHAACRLLRAHQEPLEAIGNHAKARENEKATLKRLQGGLCHEAIEAVLPRPDVQRAFGW